MKSHVSIPVPTEQFLRLASFLGAHKSGRDPVEAVSGAIEYWMENAAWKREDLLPETVNNLSGYTWKYKNANVFLPSGTDIRMSYKGRNHYARVEGDEIVYDGQPHSPSSLANTITNSSRNAWRDLWLKFPGERKWILADTFRRQFSRNADAED